MQNEMNPDWDGSWDGRKDLRVVLVGPGGNEIASVPLRNCHLKDGHAMADGVTFMDVPVGEEMIGLCIRPMLPGEYEGTEGNKSALLGWKPKQRKLHQSQGWICKISNGGFPLTGNGGDVIVYWHHKFIIHKDRMKAHVQGKEGAEQEQVFA